MKKNKARTVSHIMAHSAIIVFPTILITGSIFVWYYLYTRSFHPIKIENIKSVEKIVTTTSTKKIILKKIISPKNSVYHPSLIAHAGGDFNGFRHTNSLEALNQSYARGLRYFEIDFSTTEDGKLVLLHDWENVYRRYFPTISGPLTLVQFLNSTTTVGFTPLDLAGLKTWLLNHPNTYIIADTKEDSASVWAQLANETVDMHKRFIPQIYEIGQYMPTKNLGYDKIMLALYMNINTDEEVLNFISSTPNIWAVSLPKNYLNKELLVPQLKKMNVYVYAHVVDNKNEERKLRALGASGFYTALLHP